MLYYSQDNPDKQFNSIYQKPDGNLGNVKVQTVRPSLQQTPTSVDSLTMALSSDNPFPNNYPRPWGPLDGPSLLPASAYGRSNNTVPVNISAGIPSTRRMPGRVHTGITGPHEQEGTAIGTVYARLALPDNHGNNKMTPSSISTNTGMRFKTITIMTMMVLMMTMVIPMIMMLIIRMITILMMLSLFQSGYLHLLTPHRTQKHLRMFQYVLLVIP